MQKNATFSDINSLEADHNAMRGELPPSVNDELDADHAKARNLVKLRYAGLALFLGLIGFIFLAS